VEEEKEAAMIWASEHGDAKEDGVPEWEGDLVSQW